MPSQCQERTTERGSLCSCSSIPPTSHNESRLGESDNATQWIGGNHSLGSIAVSLVQFRENLSKFDHSEGSRFRGSSSAAVEGWLGSGNSKIEKGALNPEIRNPDVDHTHS
jgi:hypothetical protein